MTQVKPQRRSKNRTTATDAQEPERLLIVFGIDGFAVIVALSGAKMRQRYNDVRSADLHNFVGERKSRRDTGGTGIWVFEASVSAADIPVSECFPGTFRDPTQDELLAVFTGADPWKSASSK